MKESQSAYPNVFHSDKWRTTFSNVPGNSVSDMKYYDNYVKSVVIPDYNISEIRSEFMGFGIRHPVGPNVNTDLSQIQIEFKLSEDMWNYLNLFHWMQQIRYGKIDTSHRDFFRKYSVKSINIEMMDNQKRVIANVSFTEAILLSLSSLSLTQGTSEELTFTCNFSYEELVYTQESTFE